MKQRFVFMLLVAVYIAIVTISCKSKASTYKPEIKDTILVEASKPKSIIQVMYVNGYVENYEDLNNMRPKIGDTVVIVYSSYNWGKPNSGRYKGIFGYYTKRTPDNYYDDSTILEYTPAVVIKN